MPEYKLPRKTPVFVPNDIIQNESGMLFRVLDNNGAMVPIDWANGDKAKFRLMYSAYSEAPSVEDDEEELYDITPEDRKKLREHGSYV